MTNPGISAQLLKSLAKKQGFRIGQVKTGEYISIPLNYHQEDLDDKYISQFDNFLDTYTNFNKNYHTLLTAYKTFDLMEENLGEVDLILSTYVEEVLATGFVDDPLKIKIRQAWRGSNSCFFLILLIFLIRPFCSDFTGTEKGIL